MGSSYVDRLEHTQRDLASYFDKSATVVRNNFARFEKQFAQPAIAYSIASFSTNPFITTFFAIFLFISFLPAVSFLGFSIFVCASIAFVASALSFILIATVEIVLVTILAVTLTCLLVLALTLTPLVLSGYLAFGLVTRVCGGGRTGASQWATETMGHFFNPSKQEVDETIEDSDFSAGSGSVVIVDTKVETSPPSKTAKVDGDWK